MSVTVTLAGLDGLQGALDRLPEELKKEANVLIRTAAEDTMRDLLAVYPPGDMANQVVIVDRSEGLMGRYQVQSRSYKARWWEWGTQNRQTQDGWNRGAAPAHKEVALKAIARKYRGPMYDALWDLVRRNGFDLTED